MPMKLCLNNKATINIAYNLVQHDKTKHIKVDWHLIKERLDGGLIYMPYIPTIEQLEDIFTKVIHKGLIR